MKTPFGQKSVENLCSLPAFSLWHLHLLLMLVFCCFNCGRFVLGRKCYVHHVKDCCQFGSPRLHYSNSPWRKTGSNRNHRWINCGRCMTLQNIAGKYSCFVFKITPRLTAPLLWARFFCLLVQRVRVRTLLTLCFGNTNWLQEIENTVLPFLG